MSLPSQQTEFNLEKLAFASTVGDASTDVKRQTEVKQSADVPMEWVFEYNCLAHFVFRQFNKLHLDAQERIYRADKHKRDEDKVSRGDLNLFHAELAQLEQREREKRLRKAFLYEIKRNFDEETDELSLYSIMNFMRIKPEYWNYVRSNDPDQKNRIEKLDINASIATASGIDVLTLKFLVQQPRSLFNNVYDHSRVRQKLGFEFTQNPAIHNQSYPNEQKTFAEIGHSSASFDDGSTSQSGLGLDSRQHTMPPRNTAQASTSQARSSSTQNSSGNGAASTTNTSSSSSPQGWIQAIQTFATNQGGLIGALIGAAMPLLFMLQNFMEEVGKVSKANNPGRPLESHEIQDEQDHLFDHFVKALGSKDSEALTEQWRRACNSGNGVAEKVLVMENLKQSLIRAGNTEAFDDLRFSEYLVRLKNPNTRNYLAYTADKTKTQKWQILQENLMTDGLYSEADGILQYRCLEQLQKLDGNESYKGTNVVEAFNMAMRVLNAESNQSDNTPEKLEKICEDRMALLKACTTFEESIAQAKKDLPSEKKMRADIEGDLRPQYQDLFNEIPPDAVDKKKQEEAINKDFQQAVEQELEARKKLYQDGLEKPKQEAASIFVGSLKELGLYGKPHPVASRPVTFSLAASAAASAQATPHSVAVPSASSASAEAVAAARAHSAVHAVSEATVLDPVSTSGNTPPR